MAAEEVQGDLSTEVFSAYTTRHAVFTSARPHPADIVEAASLAVSALIAIYCFYTPTIMGGATHTCIYTARIGHCFDKTVWLSQLHHILLKCELQPDTSCPLERKVRSRTVPSWIIWVTRESVRVGVAGEKFDGFIVGSRHQQVVSQPGQAVDRSSVISRIFLYCHHLFPPGQRTTTHKTTIRL